MPKHIGIVGVSPEGSSICYRMVGKRASEVSNPEQRPTISLHNLPFSSYVDALRVDDWQRVADMLRQSAGTLAQAGADFCILPDNVTHHALPMASASSPIPWLNMIEIAADAIVANGCQHVGLIGTKWVVRGSTYQTLLGIRGVKLHLPSEEDAETIDRIIFDEAIYGRVRDQSLGDVTSVIEHLAEKGCEAVVLGASEAGMMLRHERMPLPIFDPLELLASAAVHHALAEASVAS
ncbi:MAG: amino acid racemase [Phycisphaerales bacterium]|nr:amino acid racemase [Phycisphaerales bacterium]